MKIHNFLPLLLDVLRRWEKKPSRSKFYKEYFTPIINIVDISFDFYKDDLYDIIESLDWRIYRNDTLSLNPVQEEARLKKHVKDVESLFGFPLQGEVILFGAFGLMDGYARFDQGSHRVYLGVDEGFGRDPYLDVLISHELCHVARESRKEVWEGWGINPQMTHDDFVDKQPVIEHIIGEGFSCAVSELLVPGLDPWHYSYQTQDSLKGILDHSELLDQLIHQEIMNPEGDFTHLYGLRRYNKNLSAFCHYVWAWQWAKQILKDKADSDPKKLVTLCSKDLLDHALNFKMSKQLI